MTARIAASIDGDVATLTGTGDLDLQVADQFREALLSAVGSGKSIVVDFRSTSYIDTAVLAALVAAARAKAQAEVGGRIKILVADKSHPQYVLKTVGFGGFMDITVEG